MEATCSIKQLIEQLKELEAQFGNLPVYLKDPDTDWIMPIGLVYSETLGYQHRAISSECLLITSEYHGYPDGSNFYEHETDETD
jgi:hypothetical protein